MGAAYFVQDRADLVSNTSYFGEVGVDLFVGFVDPYKVARAHVDSYPAIASLFAAKCSNRGVEEDAHKGALSCREGKLHDFAQSECHVLGGVVGGIPNSFGGSRGC